MESKRENRQDKIREYLNKGGYLLRGKTFYRKFVEEKEDDIKILAPFNKRINPWASLFINVAIIAQMIYSKNYVFTPEIYAWIAISIQHTLGNRFPEYRKNLVFSFLNILILSYWGYFEPGSHPFIWTAVSISGTYLLVKIVFKALIFMIDRASMDDLEFRARERFSS